MGIKREIVRPVLKMQYISVLPKCVKLIFRVVFLHAISLCECGSLKG